MMGGAAGDRFMATPDDPGEPAIFAVGPPLRPRPHRFRGSRQELPERTLPPRPYSNVGARAEDAETITTEARRGGRAMRHDARRGGAGAKRLWGGDRYHDLIGWRFVFGAFIHLAVILGVVIAASVPLAVFWH